MSNHPEKAAIKRALLENMSVILAPSTAHRRLESEQRIKMLQVTETFALEMIEISEDNKLDFALRQLALVILKQYVNLHWKQSSPSFTPPETPQYIREQVKNTLLVSLGTTGSYQITTLQQKSLPEQHFYPQDSPEHLKGGASAQSTAPLNNKDKRLRTCLAAVITNIAVCDYPDEWPNLLEVLTNYLCSSDRLIIYGAMKVFAELSRDITEQQLPHTIPILLPKMYDIFIHPSVYPISTRCRALKIFSNLCESFDVIYEGDKSSATLARKTYLDPILPNVIETLIKGLQMPINMTDSEGRAIAIVNLELKCEIINCLFTLLGVAKKVMLSWLDHLLPVVWNILTETAAMYVTYVVNSDTNPDPDLSGDLDINDGEEESSLCRLVRSIISFIQALVEIPKLRNKYIKTNITDVMYYLITYMLMTDEQMHLWKDDPDSFIMDGEEDSFSNTIRNTTFELITIFCDEFCEESEQKKINPDALWYWMSMLDALKRHFNELARNQSDMSELACTKRWKLQETCMMALCNGPEYLINIIQSKTSEAHQLSSDLMFILNAVLQNASDTYPFLTGRVLVASSKFAAIMQDDEVNRFLQATYNGLCNNSDVIKICAIRSNQTFCQFLDTGGRIHLIRPLLMQVLERLVQIGMSYSVGVLSVVLDAILTIITTDKEFALKTQEIVAPLVLSSLIKSGQSPAILMVVEEIFDELFKIRECYSHMHDLLIPTLMDILSRDGKEHHVKYGNSSSLLSLQPAALDILRTMVVESPVALSERLLHDLFPTVVKCIMSTSDDGPIIQSGGEVLRAYISKSSDQVARYIFPGTNQTGTKAALRVCLHILDPKTQENCAMFISRLVSVFIRKSHQFLSENDKQILLRSVLTKLQSVDSLGIIQSLLMIFAHLINFDHKAIVNFLSQLPAPSGNQSAFEFVIAQWLSRQHLFYGRYDQRVTLFALCTLMENSFSLLNATLVPDDGNSTDSLDQVMLTRSKARMGDRQTTWKVIPASLKIVKILLREYWEALHLDRTSINDSSSCSTLDADEESSECKITTHDDSQSSSHDIDHNSHEVNPSSSQEVEISVDSSFSSPRLRGCSRTTSFANQAKDKNVISDVSGNNDDLLKCVSYNYTDSDDMDVINDPINSISLRETLVTFLKRLKESPYINNFLSHLSDNEKSILNDI